MTGVERTLRDCRWITRLNGGAMEISAGCGLILAQFCRAFVSFHLHDTQLRTLLGETKASFDLGAVSLCHMDPCRRAHIASR